MRSLLRSAGITAAVAALMVSAACSTSTGGSAGKGVDLATATPSTTSDVESSAPPTASTATSSVAETNRTTFGQSYQWSDGLSVTVSEPAFFVPAPYAASGSATGYLKFTLTIANGTGDVFEPALLLVTTQSGDREGDRVFDDENDLGLPPSTAVLPGRQLSFELGFAVSNPLDVVMEVSPGPDYRSAFFLSAPGSVPAAAQSIQSSSAPAAGTAPAPVPSGDLNLSVPMMNPACDGSGIVLLFASVTPGAYATEIQQALDRYPGSFYLRTDQTCTSLTQSTASGDAIYAVYRFAGYDRASVCAAVEAAGGEAYGKWLDNTSDPDSSIDC